MKLYGVKSLLIVMILFLIASLFLRGIIGDVGLLSLLIVKFLFIKILHLKDNGLTVYSILNIFSTPKLILYKNINRVIIIEGGLAQALTTIKFYSCENIKIRQLTIFIYPFERKQLAKYLENKGIIVE